MVVCEILFGGIHPFGLTVLLPCLIDFHFVEHLFCLIDNGESELVFGNCMVQWVLMVDPLSYFLFQPVLHDWYYKGHGILLLYSKLMRKQIPRSEHTLFVNFEILWLWWSLLRD